MRITSTNLGSISDYYAWTLFAKQFGRQTHSTPTERPREMRDHVFCYFGARKSERSEITVYKILHLYRQNAAEKIL